MSRDLRRYARQTSVRLIIGAVLLIFVVGDGLIYFIFGPNAAISGLLCIGAGLIPVGLILILLWLMEWVVNRANRE